MAEKETTSDLAIQVAKQLVADIETRTLDFIIVASFTPERAMPSLASQVQGALFPTPQNILAFDLNAACSGFISALSVANGLLASGYQRGLVIGAEKISNILDRTDRKTAVLFGDGAGGVLVTKEKTKPFVEIIGTNGFKGDLLTAGFAETENFLTMDGRGIFSFVLKEVKHNILETLEKAQVQPEEVDYFLLHQANLRLIQQLAQKLQLPAEKFLHNLAHTGNTSAASIPLLLAEKIEAGILKLGSGQKLLLSGFGGGLTYGSIYLTL